MILEFRLSSDRETIRVSAPQADLSVQIRNLVGCHRQTKQIISLGDTADEIRANAPGYWARHGEQIEFVHPFRFDEALPSQGAYEPLIAVRVIQWYSDMAFQRLKRQSVKRMLLSPWVDRVDYVLQLAGYERLPGPTRQQFVRQLKRSLVAVRRIEINGETVAGKP